MTNQQPQLGNSGAVGLRGSGYRRSGQHGDFHRPAFASEYCGERTTFEPCKVYQSAALK